MDSEVLLPQREYSVAHNLNEIDLDMLFQINIQTLKPIATPYYILYNLRPIYHIPEMNKT